MADSQGVLPGGVFDFRSLSAGCSKMKGLECGCSFEDGECPKNLQQTTVGDRLQNLSNLGIKDNLTHIFLESILPRLSLLLPGASISW